MHIAGCGDVLRNETSSSLTSGDGDLVYRVLSWPVHRSYSVYDFSDER